MVQPGRRAEEIEEAEEEEEEEEAAVAAARSYLNASASQSRLPL